MQLEQAKQDRKSRKIQAARQRHQARVDALNNNGAERITVMDNRNFVITDQVLNDNEQDILTMFNRNTKYMSWHDMQQLVTKLRGVVETGKGSHYRIMFKDHLKGLLDKVGGLVREHESTGNELNLKLFRKAIAKVIPEQWKQAKLHAQATNNRLVF